jgi:lipopolysaccharide export system permease protein
MTTLDRYLLRAILGSVLMVTAVFLTLGGLFLFIGQQDDIGVGQYTALDALGFVLLNLPQQAWELLPISALIGTLVGLGALARGSELTVMRAAGMSVWRIARAAVVAGVLLAALAAVLGEVLAPPMQQLARQQKAFGKFDNVSFAGRGGAWVRDGDLLVNVERQSGDAQFGGMMVFELDAGHRLKAIGRAASATADPSGA